MFDRHSYLRIRNCFFQSRLWMGAVGGWYWQGQVFSQNLRNRPDIASTGEGDEFADNNYLGIAT